MQMILQVKWLGRAVTDSLLVIYGSAICIVFLKMLLLNYLVLACTMQRDILVTFPSTTIVSTINATLVPFQDNTVYNQVLHPLLFPSNNKIHFYTPPFFVHATKYLAIPYCVFLNSLLFHFVFLSNRNFCMCCPTYVI